NILRGEFRIELQEAFLRIRSDAHQLVSKLENPASEEECSNLVNSLTALVEQSVQPLVKKAIARLEDEISKLTNSIDVSSFGMIGIQLSMPEPVDLKELI